MLATALVVFREVLEAALIASIVLAATKTIPGRGWWVASGMAGGVVGACLLAGCADIVAAWASGMGQEIFNAAILFVAVAMLTWHCVWMGKHGRDMARQLDAVGNAVAEGQKSLAGLAVVVGLATLREGSEVVLFLYGIATGEPGEAAHMFIGGLFGIVGGAAMGVAMYFGLIRIPLNKLFGATNGLIMLLAAGMAAQGVGFLVAADILPPLGNTIWDTSRFLADSGVAGKMLHTLVGYTARPSGSQILAYVATLLFIAGMTYSVTRSTVK